MKKQLLIIGIIVLLIAIGLSGCLENNKENNGSNITPLSGKVTVTTNKSEYRQNETINITLYNGLNVSILHHRSISEVEKNISAGWKLFFAYNYNPNYDYDIYDPAIELKTNQSVSLEWKADHLWNWTNDTYEYCLVEPGIYRIKLSYYIEKSDFTVYSNEFTIKEMTDEEKLVGTWSFESGEKVWVFNGDKTATYTSYNGIPCEARWAASNDTLCLTLLPDGEPPQTDCSGYHFESPTVLVFDKGGTWVKT